MSKMTERLNPDTRDNVINKFAQKLKTSGYGRYEVRVMRIGGGGSRREAHQYTG